MLTNGMQNDPVTFCRTIDNTYQKKSTLNLKLRVLIPWQYNIPLKTTKQVDKWSVFTSYCSNTSFYQNTVSTSETLAIQRKLTHTKKRP